MRMNRRNDVKNRGWPPGTERRKSPPERLQKATWGSPVAPHRAPHLRTPGKPALLCTGQQGRNNSPRVPPIMVTPTEKIGSEHQQELQWRSYIHNRKFIARAKIPGQRKNGTMAQNIFLCKSYVIKLILEKSWSLSPNTVAFPEFTIFLHFCVP